MGMAPVCAGFVWDVSGAYLAPLLLSLGFSTLALISAWFLPSPSARLIPDWESHLPATFPHPRLGQPRACSGGRQDPFRVS